MTSGEMLSSYISATSSKATNNEISVRSKHVREWSMSMKSLASTLSCTQTTNKCNTFMDPTLEQANEQTKKQNETNTHKHVLKHPTPQTLKVDGPSPPLLRANELLHHLHSTTRAEENEKLHHALQNIALAATLNNEVFS